MADTKLKRGVVRVSGMLTGKLVTCCVLVMVLVYSSISPSNGIQLNSTKPLEIPVSHSLGIDLKILGFANSSTFQISASSLGENLPRTIAPLLQSSNETFGESFTLEYNITFYNETSPLNLDLRTFIKSEIVTEKAPFYLQQFFSSTDYSNYAIIPVQQLQSWLETRTPQLGLVNTRYTVVLANLTGISEMDHYYESVYGADPAAALARYKSLNYAQYYFPVVNWLNMWAYDHVFFIDLSAGSKDLSRDYTLRGFIPINSYFPKYRLLTNTTISRYIADYAKTAIRNVIIQEYSTVPPVSDYYSVKIVLLDDTGRIFQSNLQQYLNVSRVQESLQALVPDGKFNVTVQFSQMQYSVILPEHNLIDARIENVYNPGFGSTSLNVSEYDARQVHDFLQSGISNLLGTNGTQILIFALALKSASRLVETYQEGTMGPTFLNPDGDPRYASVFTFSDLALVSLSERNVFDWGVGFTRPIIQAAGRMLGIQRPTNDDPTSAMSDYSYEFSFSQFEKDAIARAHADRFLALDDGQLDQISGLTVTNFKDLTAKAMADNATAIIYLGKLAYVNLEFKSALEKYELAYVILDNLFSAHASWLGDALQSLGEGHTLAGIILLRDARGTLAAALNARAAGGLIRSFQLLSTSTLHAAAASNIEQTYDASQQNSMVFGLLLGFTLGAALIFLIFVYRSRRSRRQ